MISAFRKPRYVIQKMVCGVFSDWQWYTLFGALERRMLSSDEWGRRQRERILRVAGNPAEFGAREPSEDLLVAALDPADIEALRRFGWEATAARVTESISTAF